MTQKEFRTCPGCKVVLPYNPDLLPGDGFGRYGVASPECLALFNEIIVREYAFGQPFAVHAYAVQHPPHLEHQLELGINERLRAASHQSVFVHLLALYAMLEKKTSDDGISRALSSGARFEDEELLIPDDLGNIKVIDVAATTDEEFVEALWDWSRSAWNAWSNYHTKVEQ